MRPFIRSAMPVLALLFITGLGFADEIRVQGQGVLVAMEIPEPGVQPEVRIPAGTAGIHLITTGKLPALERFRYKLEGRDEAWQEFQTQMRLVVYFLNEKNGWVATSEFLMEGTSQGWKGTVEQSPLVPRRELVKIPPQAVKFSVAITSAGAPSALGCLALGELNVSEAGGQNGGSLLELKFPPQSGELQPPEGWGPSGDRPSMARILPAAYAPQGYVLAIVDEDVNSHGEWRSRPVPLGLSPGQTLQLEWLQSFDIGMGARRPSLRYSSLAPGRYPFRFEELTALGNPTGKVRSLVLVAEPPYWQRGWFMAASGLVSAAVAVGVTRYLSGRRSRLEIAGLRQQHALEAERARIARDIHDDLGATLTQISMLSQFLKPEAATLPQAMQKLARINQATRQMTQAMDEIVWAVNPRNDQLDQLPTFFTAYAQEFLGPAGIDFRCQFPEAFPEWRIPSIKRHNLFLAFKEALSNAVRHGGPRSILVEMKVQGNTLTLCISDDGQGFEPTQAGAGGNGLGNMQRRMEAIGGDFSLVSSPGNGTKVVFNMPLQD